MTEFCYLRARHRYYYHKLSYKANCEPSYCNLLVCDNGVKTNFSSYDLLILLIPHYRGNVLKLLKFENAIETRAIKINRIRKPELPKKRIRYHGTLVKNMVNHGILAKIMVKHGTLGTILHNHGILRKILVRSW